MGKSTNTIFVGEFCTGLNMSIKHDITDFMPDIQDSIRDIRYKYPLMLWKEIAGMRILPLNG